MKFATWNVRSLWRAAAFGEVLDELTKYKIDLCTIQEIRLSNGGILSKNLDNTLYYSGSLHDRNQFGTDVFVNKKLNSKVIDYQDLDPRICKIWLRLKPHNITILSVHAPTEDKYKEEKEEFYEELKRAYESISRPAV